MNEIMRRRRALIAASGEAIPAGYVKDGLILFLDGKQAGASSWTDLVGGKTITLTDCTYNGNGVIFNGTSSKGSYSGALSSDWNTETIEAAFSTTMADSRDILNQPAPGIILRLSLSAGDMRIITVGSRQTFRKFQATTNAKLISATKDKAFYNKVKCSSTATVTPSAPVSTLIGAREVTAGTITQYFPGTIYAIRIYNRQLTDAEILQNQQADMDRYGITI